MNKETLKSKCLRWENFLVVTLILEIIIFGLLNPKFLQARVLLGSINDFICICIISLFVTFVLITGGMDIQAGSIVGLSSISLGVLWQDAGFNIWMAVVAAICIGAVCGAISGFFVAFTRVQAMVVTLGGQFLYSGIALLVVNLSSSSAFEGISGYPKSFIALATGNIFGIPNQVVIFIVLALVGYIILHKTKYGRYIFLCGINQEAAEYSGIRTKWVIMSTYVLSGMSASVAGIVLTSYLGSARADLGKELTLPIITAVVLGGTSNLGGKGGVIGTAFAAVVIGFMRFGLVMVGLSTQYLDIPIGLLLIIAVAGRTITSNAKLMKSVHEIFRKIKRA
ncbi:ABC transporter permease [Cellulosilyticum sp. I15G10I2]|uniref:ABC transporter permease n=1 Tax=Cellulosilyticum sp. I15G10I2 TaxID=1892843 RepID=UPI00085BE4EE|nr:ABC transporter permease [Cellulosilyticum sp. I15G10I2]